MEAAGSNGRVVEPLSRHPEAKGSSPAIGTRREKMVEKVFLTFFFLFLSLPVPAAMAHRARRVVKHLSHPLKV